MASTFSLRAPLQRLFQTPASIRSILTPPSPFATTTPAPRLAAAPFSTSPAPSARNPQRGGKNRSKQPQTDPKIISMKKHLSLLSPRHIPPPLRMARNRHLRHWTVHRAWQLFRRGQREARDRELMRMHQGMYLACEELRQTEGPGTREEGYLYRVAMEKKGVYGHNGVPIEYARMQTETPAREAWNHGWKRTSAP
ncbi:hypothetical protein CONLIGDRAFT_235476 [Coniochaeta ligniaria NRRL 30616]|uniref:Uncharacterized protein n=1 Tax=Coniochaeta ligniaria NRRL 30616 TaxID=1408157 RepID=A0A1J7JQQ6_9PEZI|nr:hypothetical protein CONLIGDRAFT_235476 [Coniochaeta ligniaria NRRL 30616]